MTVYAVLTIVAKVTLVCGVAFFLARICRHTRAAVRHLVFALAFAALIAMPGAGLVLPSIAIVVPATANIPTPPAFDEARTITPVASPSTSSAARQIASTPRLTLFQMTTAAWLAGLGLCLVPVVVGLWQVRRLRSDALPWNEGRALVHRQATELGIRRSIDVLLHDAVSGPLTCGMLRPSIILPGHARHWDEASVRCALKHEIEHVARWDFLTHCLSRIVCAAYWFHPLVWAAWRQLRLEAELACDDAVIQENDASDYASLLISIAQREAAASCHGVLAMAGRDDLAARVAAVLDRGRARGRMDPRRVIPFVLTAALVILGVAPITLVRAMPQNHATATAARLRFETVSVTRNRNNDRALMYLTDKAGRGPGVGPDGLVQWMIAINGPVRVLLSSAYNSEVGINMGIGRVHQFENEPAWIDSDGFDVVAKAPFRATRQQMNEMLQSLLADRFKLEAHLGSKDVPIYALILSRSNGNPGPRLTPSQADCRPKPGAASICGLSGTSGHLVGRGITMPQLVGLLPKHLIGGHHIALDREVIDKTGLTGKFDFTVEWNPDPVSPYQPQFRFFSFPVESTAPNFVAALEEQLGLMFETQWRPEPVLVIDRIEPPTDN